MDLMEKRINAVKRRMYELGPMRPEVQGTVRRTGRTLDRVVEVEERPAQDEEGPCGLTWARQDAARLAHESTFAGPA